MSRELDEIAKLKFAYVESDGSGFRRAARTLQSIWREHSKLPIGEHNENPLGSRLPTDYAKKELANYLTPGIKKVVQDELASASDSQLYSKPRIYNDLLSSQPLCFNLFGELKLNLNLATVVFHTLRPASVKAVKNISFEYSPERSSERFTGDRSAFDVFVEYETLSGGRGFIGIEVKYHESLQEPAASHRPRYDEVAKTMECFESGSLSKLHRAPLQQLWRDHLLAGSMMHDSDLGYAEGAFVVVYPAANTYCRSAIQSYRRCLTNSVTFDAWTLEEVVGILSLATPDAWVEAFRRRYLDFSWIAGN
jgi:hypothetical protein